MRVLALCFFSLFIFSASISQVEKYDNLVLEKNKLLNESAVLNDLLKETQFSQNHTIEELTLINSKIHVQENLLIIYNQEIQALNNEEVKIEREVIKIKQQLSVLKQNYAKLIKISHRSTMAYNRLLFFLSSNNFNQLIRRLYHFKKIEINRRKKYHEIQKLKSKLDVKKELIITQKVKQSDLAISKKKELVSLNKTKKLQEKTIAFLKNKEDSLKIKIEIKNKEAKKITSTILDLLDKQKNSENQLTPELKLLSSNFQSNKGRLPWPVKKGSIVGKFGKSQHPVLSGITIINNGIDIKTNEKMVRAIFDGEISKIIVLPTGLKVVIIKHGSYLTVYSNLHNVSLQKGQKVKTKDYIGDLYDNKTKKNNILGFQIWQGREKLNPTLWISTQ
ncbi:MAG: hypothetical protein CMD26_00475 [Flavobacteriales bacterium]|nr:hypothetical protein [Flavobacteriales bacterium]|tara:strand:- start:24242 stop:25414 length:1173 start_codon:yes stop_codon:yes gene_type:complete